MCLWSPWWCDLSPGVPEGIVVAWRETLCSCGCRGGVVGPLVFLWLPWGSGVSSGVPVAAVWAYGSPGVPVVALEALRVPWSSCGHRGGVTGPLVFLWLP